MKITIDWVLTTSGRVLVRLGGGVKKTRLRKKRRKKLKKFKGLFKLPKNCIAVTQLLSARISFLIV